MTLFVKKHFQLSSILLSILTQLSISTSKAQAVTVKEGLNLVGSSFVSPSIVDTLNIMQQIPNGSVFNQSASFSESGFNDSLSGTFYDNSKNQTVPFSLAVEGKLNGEIGDKNIILSVVSSGFLGKKNISSSATITFPLVPESNDYGDALYEETVRINPKGVKKGKLIPRGRGWIGWLAALGTQVGSYFFDSTVEVELPNGKTVKKKEGSTYTFKEYEPNTNKVKCEYVYKDPMVSSFCFANPVTKTLISKATVVPEPLTILGSVAALGFGTVLKRKHSKKRQNQAS
jgi:hypothetical protein